jgi:hypothetical protein
MAPEKIWIPNSLIDKGLSVKVATEGLNPGQTRVIILMWSVCVIAKAPHAPLGSEWP